MKNLGFFKASMPSSRPADYYLGGLDSAVFIDFVGNSSDQISLVRISFDGYGCCELGSNSNLLSAEDSALFIKQMAQDQLDQEIMKALVKKTIVVNQAHIWPDALKEYGLFDVIK